jgi:cap1 methyltransferase
MQIIGPNMTNFCATEDDALGRRHALDSLTMQLRQVKRRLGPATSQCALAMRTSGRLEFDEARRACNSFELLGEGRQHGGLNQIFMNRSAMKLANLDAILDFSLTRVSCPSPYQQHLPFLFADLCGAPGGFSEYLMRRCNANGIPCRGYGMSLLGTNEHGRGTQWKLRDMREGWCDYRVFQGADGTGDIYKWENVESLHYEITTDMQTAGLLPPQQGVFDGGKMDLVVADGGFDAQRDSECQEELAQKIVVCQAAAALALLARGGTLVIKMFGFRTAVVRAVMNDLFTAFDKTVAIKPISSRPASAERYVVFTGFHGISPGWNGVHWRSQMFLADWRMQMDAATSDNNNSNNPLWRYLDEFDRNMLTLNLTTCFDILTYLERKAQNDCEYNQNDSLLPDLMAYKHAWKLLALEYSM